MGEDNMISLLRKPRATGEAPHLPAPKILSLPEWKDRVKVNIGDDRSMLEHWLGELDLCVNGKRNLEGVELDKTTCECTRMVRVAGRTLHSNTELYKIETKELRVPGEWDLELAQKTDSLLQKAQEMVVTDTEKLRCKMNCRERAEYVREQWREWCPEYARELESQGVKIPAAEPFD